MDGLSYCVRLRDDVTVERSENGRITIFRQKAKVLDVAGNPLIEGFAGGWMTEASMDRLAERAANPAIVYYMCEKLFSLGILQGQYSLPGKVLFTLIPAPGWDTLRKKVPVSLQRLSPSAWLRRRGRQLILEMPLSQSLCIIDDEKCLSWLMEIIKRGIMLPLEDIAQMSFYRVLLYMGALIEDGPGNDVWEFHDLLFFHHSSIGFHADAAGAHWRLKDKLSPAPLFKPCTGESFPLPEPDSHLAEKLRMPFAEVATARRTGRVPGKKPVNLNELGALLYQSARVQEIRDEPGQPYAVSLRSSPSGGALHSLEIYLLVRECLGLAAGAWRYDPAHHRLESIAAIETLLDTYLTENPHPQIEGVGLPQVRLVVASRFLRVAWKYEKIAYRLVLQDVGCLYQTLSLTATALGLNSCILGAVDAGRLGKILKLEPLVEPVIGEMLISSQ